MQNDLLTELIDDYQKRFFYYKTLSEDAMAQISDDIFFQIPAGNSNSIAAIVKHIGGNLKSRWSGFLTSDGEKPDRDRDNEFNVSEDRKTIMMAWESGWMSLRKNLESLKPEDLSKTVLIRGQAFSVPSAIHRSLAHTSYHAGQIVYLCRMQHPGTWKWLTIAPGKSDEYRPSKPTG